MKYLGATLIFFALLLPFQAAHAELPITEAGNGRPATADIAPSALTNENVSAIADKVSRDMKALIDKGEQLGCGQASGEHGGSLAASLEQLMRGLIDDVKGSLMGAARGQVRDFLNRISANAGPLAPVVQPLVNFIGAKADALIRQVGEKIFSFIDPSGAATTALSGVAQAVGLNLGNIGIGAGLLGDLPVAGIGASVPVTETGAQLSLTRSIEGSTLRTEPLIKYMRDASGTQLYVACVVNPAISKSKNGIVANQVRGMVQTAAEKQVTNVFEASQRSGDFYARKSIEASAQGMCSSHRQEVMEMVINQFSGARTTAQCSEENEQKPGADFDFQKQVASLANPGNVPAMQFFNAIAKATQEGLAATAVTVLEYHKNEGFSNTYECTEAERDLKPGEVCINGQVVLHGKMVAGALSSALNAPMQQLIQADEIGELIDAMSAGLMQVAFQNVRGILGLVEKSGSRGSYLDEMVAQNYDESAISPQRVLTGDIAAALDTETQYGQALDIILADLATAKKNYESAAACYEPIRSQGKGDITPQIARDAVALATTTVGIAINPQVSLLLTEKASSDSALGELVELVNAAETALSQKDIVEVSSRFSALKASGRMHTTTDLQALINSMEFGAASIERMLRDATILLAACTKAV
ncbi:hypothetical protein KGO06_02195 [Patescibacteria group bacterium]|nr:hypothetical protein [Patescibacteria group bacterium]